MRSATPELRPHGLADTAAPCGHNQSTLPRCICGATKVVGDAGEHITADVLVPGLTHYRGGDDAPGRRLLLSAASTSGMVADPRGGTGQVRDQVDVQGRCSTDLAPRLAHDHVKPGKASRAFLVRGSSWMQMVETGPGSSAGYLDQHRQKPCSSQ